ncbi:MAG: hypothetical protein BroJett026_11090 [Betaproteobacteria bacterium]|nr:MAG: hypothetical protein BroJett026_11090 [Betaproteobacteria bacterium]
MVGNVKRADVPNRGAAVKSVDTRAMARAVRRNRRAGPRLGVANVLCLARPCTGPRRSLARGHDDAPARKSASHHIGFTGMPACT